jgi:hypothetical protein
MGDNPEDTWKGQMYPDLGLGNWKFELQTATGSEIADRLLKVHADYDAALAPARKASEDAAKRRAKAMVLVKDVLMKA